MQRFVSGFVAGAFICSKNDCKPYIEKIEQTVEQKIKELKKNLDEK